MSSAFHELVSCNARVKGRSAHKLRVQQSRHDQFHTHRERNKVSTSAKRFYAERELRSVHQLSFRNDSNSVGFKLSDLLKTSGTNVQPSSACSASATTYFAFPPSGPTLTKKGHMDLSPRRPNFVFVVMNGSQRCEMHNLAFCWWVGWARSSAQILLLPF